MKFVYIIFILFASWRSVRTDCGVVAKRAWGGLSPVHVEYLPRPVSLVIIQHTVTPFCETDRQCVAIMRSLQDNHMDNLKYWDIGMNFVVGGNGKIYEGSGWLHVGAHTIGYNRKSIGISFIGNYNNKEASNRQLEAVRSLLSCGVRQGHLASNYHVVGHKQVLATESPGRYLYNQIRRWPEWLENTDNL
uniref:Peptidoglycan-recognition protein n=1 Tax=Antheraea pernyi TaxID=7119 RepID=B2CZ95_ANTPE|nr:peptidoglycan recognition protein-like protein [Antheraea pernyi]